MEIPEAPVTVLIAGVLLIFTSIIVTFVVVLKPRNAIPLSRRRPDVPASTSRLTLLTETAVGAINKRMKGRNDFLVNRDKLERAGLKTQPADFLLMMGAGALAGSVFGSSSQSFCSQLFPPECSPLFRYSPQGARASSTSNCRTPCKC